MCVWHMSKTCVRLQVCTETQTMTPNSKPSVHWEHLLALTGNRYLSIFEHKKKLIYFKEKMNNVELSRDCHLSFDTLNIFILKSYLTSFAWKPFLIAMCRKKWCFLEILEPPADIWAWKENIEWLNRRALQSDSVEEGNALHKLNQKQTPFVGDTARAT